MYYSHLVYKLALLIGAPELEELLDDIVAEHVGHQAVGRGQDLLEDQLFLSGSRSLQFLLDESGAMLVLTELDNMVGKIPQLEIRVAIIPAKHDFRKQAIILSRRVRLQKSVQLGDLDLKSFCKSWKIRP